MFICLEQTVIIRPYGILLPVYLIFLEIFSIISFDVFNYFRLLALRRENLT